MKIPKAPPGKKFMKVTATMLFVIDELPKGLPSNINISSVMDALHPDNVATKYNGEYMGGECKIEVVMKKGKT